MNSTEKALLFTAIGGEATFICFLLVFFGDLSPNIFLSTILSTPALICMCILTVFYLMVTVDHDDVLAGFFGTFLPFFLLFSFFSIIVVKIMWRRPEILSFYWRNMVLFGFVLLILPNLLFGSTFLRFFVYRKLKKAKTESELSEILADGDRMRMLLDFYQENKTLVIATRTLLEKLDGKSDDEKALILREFHDKNGGYFYKNSDNYNYKERYDYDSIKPTCFKYGKYGEGINPEFFVENQERLREIKGSSDTEKKQMLFDFYQENKELVLATRKFIVTRFDEKLVSCWDFYNKVQCL